MTVTYIIPKNSIIFVTGASGFIGSHCVNELLSFGYDVRMAVRSKERGNQLVTYFSKRHSNTVEYALISDITDIKALSSAMSGCRGVLHLASPYTYDVTDFEAQLMRPALQGTQAVLEAAMANSSIQRVVITSSFAAVFDASKGPQPGVVLNEKDFSPLTYEDGISTSEPAVAYRASKIVAEMAAWNFVKERNATFDIAVICPPMVYGPLVSTELLKSLSELNFSNSTIWNMVRSGNDAMVPPTKGPVWIDVRDLAFAHVKALLVPEASNERFLVVAGTFCNQEICDLLKETLPKDKADLVPTGEKGARIAGTHYTTDSSKAEKLLDVKFRPLKSSIAELVEQLYTIA